MFLAYLLMKMTENINNSYMNFQITAENGHVRTVDQVVILDECGDTMWDSVLDQEETPALKQSEETSD